MELDNGNGTERLSVGVGEGGSEGVGARETVKAQTRCNWITASVFNTT